MKTLLAIVVITISANAMAEEINSAELASNGSIDCAISRFTPKAIVDTNIDETPSTGKTFGSAIIVSAR